MKTIFHQINASFSRTAIEYIAERAIPTASDADRVILQRIIEADNLDEIYALCAEAFGDPETAQSIRQERAARLARAVPMDSELKAMLAL
jgi:hypothetical protein